ncbi:hypothetical protein GQX74_004863 [Glossina fuscipes]|nr:hypothetical protein GQX74_004863 [Glossina fuscipes]
MEISIKWNICRVCLQEETDSYKAPPGGHMHYLFDDNSEEFAKEIYECVGLTISPDDNLPQKICSHCLTVLRYAVNFRKTCRESEEYLQSVIERTKSASALFKLDRRQKNRLHFLDENDENSIPYYDSNEEGRLVDSESADYVKADIKKRKSRGKRFSGHIRKYTKRSLDLPTCSKLLPIKENDLSRTETDLYKEEEEEEQDDINEIIMEKDNDGKPAENEEIKINECENEKENDDIIEEDKVIAETFTSKDPNTAEHSQKYTEENENNPNESCMESDYNHNSLSPNMFDFSNLCDFITKLTSPENNIEKDFITERCDDEHDDEHDDDNQDSDNTVKEDDDKDDLIETNPSIENAENETTKQDCEIEEEVNLEALEEFENVEMTPTSREHYDEKHDDDDNQYFEEEEDALKISYTDREAFENIEYILPDIDENVGAKGDDNAAKHTNKGKVRSQRTFKKEEGNAYDNSPISCALLCDICGNTFSTRFLLNIHLRTHRQEKPHECELCLKRFTTACYLQAHMRVHIGEKNFDCRFCRRRSTDRSPHIKQERLK